MNFYALNLLPNSVMIMEKKTMSEKKPVDIVQIICIAIGVFIGFLFVRLVLGLGGIIGGALGGGLGAALGLGIFALVSKARG